MGVSRERRVIDMTTCVPVFGRAHEARHGVQIKGSLELVTFCWGWV